MFPQNFPQILEKFGFTSMVYARSIAKSGMAINRAQLVRDEMKTIKDAYMAIFGFAGVDTDLPLHTEHDGDPDR